MSEKHRGTTSRLGYRSLLFTLALIALLSALTGCGSGQTDVGQSNGNSVPVNLSITMPTNVAAAPAPTHPLVVFVQRWLFPTDAWAATARDISALVIQVTGPDIPSPITHREPVRNAESGQVIPIEINVPVGQDRVFSVSALNAANQTIFHGQSESVVLTPGQTATVNVPLADTTIRILTETLPDGTEDRSYIATMVVERASGAVTWTIINGRLPPGVTLNSSTGEMSGTPTAIGVFPITVRATDASAIFDEAQLRITINPTPVPPTIETRTLPLGTVGSPYRATLVARGGTGASTWNVVAGTLPPGLTLNASTGGIAGSPTTASGEDPVNFTVRATDTLGLTGERALSIRINPAPVPPNITTTTLPGGTERAQYNTTLTATGGTGTLTWSLRSGNLPPGVSLNGRTGAMTGTPTGNGRFDFTVRATDTLRLFDEQALTITIANTPIPPPTITTTTLPVWMPGVDYNARLQVTGGTGAITWSVVAGDLPCCLDLNSATGEITGGNDSNDGTFRFTVRATDSEGRFDEQDLAIMVSSRPEPPSITTTSLPGGTVGAQYSARIEATGGTGALSWTTTSGSCTPAPCALVDFLPQNLTLDKSTGIIAGTPLTKPTVNTVVVRVTDTLGQTDSQEFSITITPPLTITTTELPEGCVLSPYPGLFTGTVTLSASGGSPPYTWSIEAGLPPAPGLTLSPSGAITGISNSQDGPFTRNYRVRDSSGAVDTRFLALNVLSALACIN